MPISPEKMDSPEELEKIYQEQLDIIFSGEPDFMVEEPELDVSPEGVDPLNQIVNADHLSAYESVIKRENLDCLSQVYLIAAFEGRTLWRISQAEASKQDPGRIDEALSYLSTWRALVDRYEESDQTEEQRKEIAKMIDRLRDEDQYGAAMALFGDHLNMLESFRYHQGLVRHFLSEDQRKKLKDLVDECQKAVDAN